MTSEMVSRSSQFDCLSMMTRLLMHDYWHLAQSEEGLLSLSCFHLRCN